MARSRTTVTACEPMSSETTPPHLSRLALIDVHHHVLLPEYEQALVRSGAGDPSRPFRRHDGPAVTVEKMAELGIAAAVVNPLSVAGVHHGDDANARYLTRSVNEALAKFSSGAPDRLLRHAADAGRRRDARRDDLRARYAGRRRRGPAVAPERRLCRRSARRA